MAIKFGKKAGPIAGTLDEEEQRRQMAQQDDQQQPLDRIRGNQETDIYGMAADNSVFGEAAKDLTLENVDPGLHTVVQDYADTLNRDQDQDQPGEPTDGGAPPPAEEEPQGLFEDVTDIDARQERERAAFADELAARKAEQQQQAEARAGLGGMGLSGATAELVGDVGRQAERAGDIAMADLGRRQQQETFDELRRQASIWTFEEEFNVDLDGDGKIGSGESEDKGGVPDGVLPPEAHANAPSSREGTVLKPIEDVKDAVAEFTGRGDVKLTAAPGHPDNPMQVEPQELPPGAKQVGTDDEGNIIYEGPDGTYYKTKSSAEGFREWGA